MLAIKLQRIGKKHQPGYRLVVAERRSKMIAPPVEDLGAYNPFSKVITFKKERVEYWLSKGAMPTETVHNLLVTKGVINGKKVAIKMRKSKGGAEAPKVAVEVKSEPVAEVAI
ncbi:MAG: 30S ribosomal protein S16 [Patescibacteria group bacterium]